MLRLLVVLLLVTGSTFTVQAQSALTISGKLRVLSPLDIKVTTIEGEEVLAACVSKDGTFRLGPRKIVPDVYILWMGKTRQPIYLTNTEVIIKGYYDEVKPENSSLSFTGIDEFLELSKWIPTERSAKKRTIDPRVRGRLRGSMYSALAYLSDIDDYETNKMLLDEALVEGRDALSTGWLSRKVDSLSRFAVGAQAYDFEYVDVNGKNVKLSDFRGKYVLVDFWASWCGPCRHEMKNLLPIYEELKGEDLEFISVSLDKREKDWRNMIQEEKLPWVMLWNREGFTIGNEPNTIQKAYGFYGIPFIVLIDKDGKIVARDLRGDKVKEEILKVRNR